jgi:hypothetical protein
MNTLLIGYCRRSDDLYSYDYSRPTDAVATGATAAHFLEDDDESAQEPAYVVQA